MYIGIDIGGTNVKYGVVDENCKIYEKHTIVTEKSSDVALMGALAEICISLKEKYNIKGIGIGAPGYVDSKNGIFQRADNLPFNNTDAGKLVGEKAGLPVYIGNDANCAALGEYYGGGKVADNMVMITLGTGVGGGIVIGGKLYTGTNGLAGEMGHMTIIMDGKKCPCGKHGCYEKYASVTALMQQANDAIAANPDGMMAKELKEKSEEVSGRNLFAFADKGYDDAVMILDNYTRYVANGLENIVDIFQPDEIVLAGGITNDEEILMNSLNKSFSKRCKVRVSCLKNDAGLVGAAALAFGK